MAQLFSLGRTVQTSGVASLVYDGKLLLDEIFRLIDRHVSGDFGEICSEDKETNMYAILNGERIMSVYSISGVKLWVITEADRSVTTVLLPEEY